VVVGAVKELPIGRFKPWKVEVEEPLRNGLQQTNMFQVLWGNSLKAHPKGAAAKDGFGDIVQAVGEKQYLVRFDNGEERELPSAVLKAERMVASLPPDAVIPVAQNVHEEAMLETAPDELIQDAEEGEDVPVDTPEA